MARTTNLLLVEDNLTVREALNQVLTTENYSVLNAASCRDAVLAFHENQIDIVVLDLNLGDESGWTVFHALKELRSDVPIIVTSAHRDLLAHSSATKASAVLEKPFDLSILLRFLKQVVQPRLCSYLNAILVTTLMLLAVCSPFSAGAQDVAPQSLEITHLEIQNGNVIVQWQGGGTNNQAQCRTNLTAPWQDVDLPTSGSSVTNIMTDPSAFYRVVNLAINAAAGTDKQKPSVPSAFRATAVSCSQVDLFWNAATDPSPSSGIKGYNVYRNNTFLRQVPAAGSTYSTSDTGLRGSTTYTYSVLTLDNAGHASAKTNFTVTTPSCGGTADTTPPSASLTSPGSGSTVSSTITLAATATDNMGVSRVEFYCNSSVLLGTATTAPWTAPCNTATLPNGTHSFYCKAYDAAGNATTSATVGVTVNNSSSGTPGTLQWVRPMPCINGTVFVQGFASDHAGNAVLVGYFSGTVTIGANTLTSPAGGFYTGVLMVKCDPQGNVIWAKQFGSIGLWSAAGFVAIDSQDNIIVAGDIQNTGSIDFGAGPIANAGTGYQNWVAKFSPSGVCNGANGTWAKTFPGATKGPVAVDASDNIIVAPAISYGSATFGSTVLTTAGGIFDQDFALVKLSGTTGAVSWAIRRGGVNNDGATAIKIDPASGDLVVVGSFSNFSGGSNSTDLGGGTVAGIGGTDMFLARYAADGSYKGAKIIGGTGNDFIRALAIDPNTGNAIIGGAFSGTVNFGGGDVYSDGTGGAFMAGYRWDSTSSTWQYLWVKTTGGSGTTQVYGVSVNASGRLAIAGTATSAINWGTWPQNLSLFPIGGPNAFIASFSISGDSAPVYRWTKLCGGMDVDSAGNGVALSPAGEIMAGGKFQGTADFGGTSATAGMAAYYSGFMAKYVH